MTELSLPDLRRYAIHHRVDVKLTDPDAGRELLINDKGQVKIPAEDKDFRAEDVLAAARSFEVIRPGKSTRLTREAMAQAVREAFKGRGPAAAKEEE